MPCLSLPWESSHICWGLFSALSSESSIITWECVLKKKKKKFLASRVWSKECESLSELHWCRNQAESVPNSLGLKNLINFKPKFADLRDGAERGGMGHWSPWTRQYCGCLIWACQTFSAGHGTTFSVSPSLAGKKPSMVHAARDVFVLCSGTRRVRATVAFCTLTHAHTF